MTHDRRRRRRAATRATSGRGEAAGAGSATGCCTRYTWLIIAWLFLPIAVMIVFGFNDTQSSYNLTWQGFTLKWYGPPVRLSRPDRRRCSTRC